jgi:hypothetical protein
MKLKKYALKKRKRKLSKPGRFSKFRLISQTRNLWNLRPVINQEFKFSTNLILNDEIRKNINLIKFPK